MRQSLKKLLYILPVSSMLALSSCEKKIDEAFTNPNAAVVQPIETLLPGVIANMVVSASANGSFYGTQRDGSYLGKWIQNFVTNSTGNRQDQMSDFYGTTTPDLQGDIWAMHYYGHGQNIERIIQWGTEQEKWDYVGVAKAIRAWGWLTLTDVTDDVILHEAFNPSQLTFNYNTQEEVYEKVKELSYEALNYLSRTDGNVSQANLNKGDAYFNQGDVNKWKKFVYGVLARTFHRTTNKGAAYQADSVLKYVNLAAQDNSENSMISWSRDGGSGTYSWFSVFRANLGTWRQSRFIAELMSGQNDQFPTGEIDPRAIYIIRENSVGTFRGARPNKGADATLIPAAELPQNFYGGAFSSTTGSNSSARYIFRNEARWPIITAYEMKFIKAEALYRKGFISDARDAYVQALNLHFDHLIAEYEVNVPGTKVITPAQRAAFFANPINVPPVASFSLSHIMLQKYIAMYGWGVIETWVDMRRYHYIDLDPLTGQQVYREFTLPAPGVDLYSGNSGLPAYRQRPRYNSEYLYNQAELSRLGAFANDYITKEMWFSKP
jgi:hypothetical protein